MISSEKLLYDFGFNDHVRLVGAEGLEVFLAIVPEPALIEAHAGVADSAEIQSIVVARDNAAKGAEAALLAERGVLAVIDENLGGVGVRAGFRESNSCSATAYGHRAS